MSGLEERVFGRLPDATSIYPGHGNDTTLGAERPHLAEWRARGWKELIARRYARSDPGQSRSPLRPRAFPDR
jgi:glyoxylase-like metal-dependent hydrolase (beta-lactamase superfamily II)